MMSPIRDPFTHILPPAEPPVGLREAVLSRLDREQTRMAWRRFTVDAAIACFSAVAFVLTARLFLADLASSGAFQYLSILFTNSATALAYWKDSVVSFAEAFPVLTAAAPLGAVLILLVSLQRAFIDASSAFHHHHRTA